MSAPPRILGVPLDVAVVLAVCVAILVIAWWVRRRTSRGDWGPGLGPRDGDVGSGYVPQDLRRGVAPTRVRGAHERWLLGLAAPHVEVQRLVHDRWSLVPADADDAWRRKLGIVAGQMGVTRRADWVRLLELREAQLADETRPADDPGRVWLTATVAMLLRMGVALRYIDGRRARRRLEVAAAPLRGVYRDWLQYGDAFLEAAGSSSLASALDLRADLRVLYAPDGPWGELAWPAAPPPPGDGRRGAVSGR